MDAAFPLTAQATLLARRRSVLPAAIGRIPPPFLLKAESVAPKKKDDSSSGMLPARMKLVSEVRAEPSSAESS